jgi:hypothetical protein
MTYHNTNEHYSPHDQLPAPVPKETQYLSRHFYENTAKHLIKDTVRIMMNGLHIDLNKVVELEATLDTILAEVDATLAENPIIKEFQQIQHAKLIEKYIQCRQTKLRPTEYYVVRFKHEDKVHRSYFMYVYTKSKDISQPKDLLPTGVPQWSARLVKKFSNEHPLLKKLLDGELSSTHPMVVEAIQLLAKHKADMYNEKYIRQIKAPNVPVPPFNPGSPLQKRALFEWLGIESENKSKKTDEDSFNREEIERIYKETVDEDVKQIAAQLIEHSFAAIVRNNFIKGFYTYTVNSRLHGNLVLFGAKTFRLTSNSP